MMVAAVGRRLAEATTVDASAAAATSTVTAVAMSMAAVERAAATEARLARCSQRVRW